MTTHNEPSIARRPFLKGAGVTLAALGGMTGSAAARGNGKGVRRLADLPADILVYWSRVDDESNDPNHPTDFGFPNLAPDADGGMAMPPAHDQADGGMFDFSRIKMMPNGDLKNRWLLFGGAVMATPPKPYELEHLGGGRYRSRGQRMTFQARSADQIKAILGTPELPPALALLAGGRWRAVGLEFAELDLDASGDPDPALPKWGATRIDFYDQTSMTYGLSLLYVIVASTTPSPLDGLPSSPAAQTIAGQLIFGGRLDPRGRR